ncbi:MAG: hypothetical protein OEM66_00220, partial [Acidimicrobiia bacterium]|nr:hypothetical protein [Acidimicrobiia bacterium]
LIDSSSTEAGDPGSSDVVDATVNAVAAAIFFRDGTALSAVTVPILLLVAGIATTARTKNRMRKPKEKE